MSDNKDLKPEKPKQAQPTVNVSTTPTPPPAREKLMATGINSCPLQAIDNENDIIKADKKD